MQDQDDMTFNPAPTARTTAAGLEAWLTGAHADPGTATVLPERGEIDAMDSPAGPVNAAEALVLDAVSGARRLVGPDGAELVLDPEHDAYYFETTSLKPLAPLLQQNAGNWLPIYSEALQRVREANAAQPLERLRWYAGLIATPGILARRLVSGARYKLARWPETEREFPRHFRIARAMLKLPATAEEIAAASETSLDEAIDYINASHAAGRLEASQPGRKAETRSATDGGSRKSRLISRLNKPLFAR